MKRFINPLILNNILSSSLWSNLKKDCETQKVFLAIRNNYIDFYHKGGRLFHFDKNGFSTHLKFASVINFQKNDYVTEKNLDDIKLTTDFKTNYERIKENCSLYSGVEASGVSEIYHLHSYLSKDDNIVVLDIEISFESVDENKNQDRIDLLLLNKSTQTLHFVEAKHFSNPEIWSTGKPKVIKQLERYENQLLNKDEIIQQFSDYTNKVNVLFGCKLPVPLNLDEKVALLIFGFDKDQRDGRLKTLIHEKKYYEPFKVKCIGNLSNLDLKTLL